ncbi:unnamed protein product [Paramecium octaurelia]|uniref:Reverse transcriptase domain-containing protein n=1 Tax=Paramecium octaurelia TaxID=43137 RepID=A0A8S1YHP0_PAROT|nr:unnamed protein product [Paramecium octaurelia]
MQRKMSLRQNDFVKGGGVQINIFHIFQRMQIIKQQDRISLSFIDFEIQYYIQRQIVLNSQDQNYLRGKEIQLLEAMYSLIYYRVAEAKECYQFKDGLPQESLLSPGLFYIYLEASLDEIERKAYILYEEFEYADDLAIIIKNKFLKSFIRCLSEECMKWNLKIYQNQMWNYQVEVRNNKIKKIEGIPIVESYTYLGIVINRLGNLKDHITKTKQRIQYIVKELSWISQYMNYKERINLWIAFNRPHFQYLAVAAHLNKISHINKKQIGYIKDLQKLQQGVPRLNRKLNCQFSRQPQQIVYVLYQENDY